MDDEDAPTLMGPVFAPAPREEHTHDVRVTPGQATGDAMNVIETRKLTKYYGRSRGIEDLDMAVAAGEIYGFIGPNGAGKSTTLRTLLGLIHPTAGSASVFGKDITTSGPAIRQQIGYLPSEVFYYDDMRAIDLLRYSASFYDRDSKETEKRARELAERFDLDLKKKIDDLSYGNKKKVGIVQGLAHKPRLIMLDEPTGGLDPLIQQEFFHLLREENAEGATVLFSSHILSEVQKLCDRVAIIKDGSIIRVDQIKALLETATKRFKLELATRPDASVFSMEGISDLEIANHSVGFLFRGRLNDITALLAGLDLRDLQVIEPDLEEIFLHYYQKEE